MLSPALSFAWILWRQHGRGLLVVLGYLLIAGAVSVAMPAPVPNDEWHDFKATVFGFIFVPLFLLPFYAMVVFAYGLDVVDVASGESCFPARLFQLPVRTGALTLWPMLYGAATALLIWLAIVSFILWPWGRLVLGFDRVPLWWPGLLAAAALAYLQAVLWFPFGLPWLRVVFLAALLPAVIILANFGVHSGSSEGALVGMLAGFTATAWGVAYVGVRRARGGAVINWEWLLWPARQLAGLLPQRRTPFALAAQAQEWYEWRLSRFVQPIIVGMGLTVFLWMFFVDRRSGIPVAVPLTWSFAVPVFCAGIGVEWLRSGKTRSVQNRYGLAPFLATLPMSSADMVGALLRATVWSTLAAWAIVIVAVPLVVVLSGRLGDVLAFLEKEWQDQRPLDIAVRIVAVAALLLVWTWKRRVYRLCLGLTGRKWLEITLGWGRLPAYVLFFQIPRLIDELHISDQTVLAVLPWVIGLYILCRMAAAAWALRQGVRRGLLEARTAKRWIAGWLLVAAALFAVVVWAAPEHMPMFYRTMPLYYCAAAVLFVMPMARLAATPLALAWNRHR
jgi:hypothetical protein